MTRRRPLDARPLRLPTLLTLLAAAVALALPAVRLAAQEETLPRVPSEIVRGRVVDDSGRAVVATVVVTRGPDRLVKQVTSDSAGIWSLQFEPGTGDYLVYVSATGFRAAR